MRERSRVSQRRRGGSAPRILLTQAGGRVVLAACRTLGAAGYDVTQVSFERLVVGHWSRWCDEGLRATSPRRDGESFVAELAETLAARPYASVIPCGDSALLAISHHREQLEGHTDLGLPPHPAVLRSLDREALATAADDAGLSAATAVRCASLEDAIAATRELGLPVLVKSIETAYINGRAVLAGPDTHLISSESDLEHAVPNNGAPFLIQRFESGDLYSFGGVIADGRLLGAALSRYLRTWPPGAGNVAFSETVALDSDLADKVEHMLAKLGWQGLFELELIRTASDRFVPADLNPRPYGSMWLATVAGAPLTSVWCDWLLGRAPQPVVARPGVRYRWEDADLRHMLYQLRRGRLREAAAVSRPRRQVVHAYFNRRDPMPSVIRALQGFQRPAIRLWRTLRRPSDRRARVDDRPEEDLQ